MDPTAFNPTSPAEPSEPAAQPSGTPSSMPSDPSSVPNLQPPASAPKPDPTLTPAYDWSAPTPTPPVDTMTQPVFDAAPDMAQPATTLTSSVLPEPMPPVVSEVLPFTQPTPLVAEAPSTPYQPIQAVSMDAVQAPAPLGIPDTAPTNAPLGQIDPSGPFTGSMPTEPASFNTRMKGAKKSRLLMLGGGLIVIIAAAGIVFGYVLPNQPTAVWNTGLSRSGKALNQLIDTATTKTSLDAYKKSNITASLTAKWDDINFSGNFDTKFDATSANGNLNVTAKQAGSPDQTYSLKFIGQLLKDHTYPSTYVQLNGLKLVDLDAFVPGLGAFDGKWIHYNEDFYKMAGFTADTVSKKQLTSDDIAALAKAATSVTTEYVFSTDSKKAVFERRKNIGKETVDSISAYHYKVGINRANLVSYCKAAIDKVTSVDAFKRLPGVNAATINTDKAGWKKDCDDISKDMKDSETFDLWVDAKYKLIYKVRFVDDKNSNSYVDIGQTYKGGDDVTMFSHSYDADSKLDIKGSVKTNTKTRVTSGNLTVNGSGSSSFDMELKLEAKPYNGDIDVTPPAGAVKIEDVLKALGIDPGLLGDSSGLNSI